MMPNMSFPRTRKRESSAAPAVRRESDTRLRGYDKASEPRLRAGLASDWSGISAFVRPADRIDPRHEAADVYRRGYRRYRDLYRRLAERSEVPA
jgi:hypothetical protein